LGLRGIKTCEVVNPLEVLLSLNEKMEAAALGDLMPPSRISSQWDLLYEFGKAQGRTVLKPLHEAQSHGIELLDWRTPDSIEDAKMKLSLSTQRFQTPVILQTYLEGIAEGETRLWFIDGKLLATVKKFPVTGDFRVNIDRGSQLSQTTLSRSDRTQALKIAKHLKNRKIRLAAVDLIEGYVTDFNLTSPGLIPLMEATLGENLAKPIVQALFGHLS
jgi:glutathione synthase